MVKVLLCIPRNQSILIEFLQAALKFLPAIVTICHALFFLLFFFFVFFKLKQHLLLLFNIAVNQNCFPTSLLVWYGRQLLRACREYSGNAELPLLPLSNRTAMKETNISFRVLLKFITCNFRLFTIFPFPKIQNKIIWGTSFEPVMSNLLHKHCPGS